MAKSAAEKKEYNRQYYLEYRKKGKKKGRKKGSSKKSTKKTNLVGLSTGGLNDQGKMQWALAKEKLSSEMNAALGKAKTQAEKDQIRSEYQNKAMQELSKMKNDSSLAKAKKTSTKSSSSKSSTKSSSSKSSSSSKGSSSKSSSSSASSSNTAATQAAQQMAEAVQQMKDYITQLTEKLMGSSTGDSESIESAMSDLTEAQREQVRTTIQNTIEAIKKKLNKE